MNSKVAIASDDEVHISHHFGRAEGYVVFEINEGEIVMYEYRSNIGMHSGQCVSCDHVAMIGNIKDCDFVISYGMGRCIYNDLVSNGIKPVVTDEETVGRTLHSFIENKLVNRTDRLH